MSSKNEGMSLTYKTGDAEVTWKSDYVDADMEEILYGFYGLCIAHAWQPITVAEAMAEFAKNQLELLRPETDTGELSPDPLIYSNEA